VPYAIVLLDLKGYSKLPARGVDDVFEVLLPKLHELLRESKDRHELIDSNTWGDSLLTVFQGTGAAVRFALRVKQAITLEPWDSERLHALGVRIALHVTDAKHGKDPFRLDDPFGSGRSPTHIYGTGMVLPARVEPIVPPNTVCFTEAALNHVQEVIKADGTRATAHLLGDVELAKGYGTTKLWCLVHPGEKVPTITREEPPAATPPDPLVSGGGPVDVVELMRAHTLQQIARTVESFRVFSASAAKPAVLADAFIKHHRWVIERMQWATNRGRGQLAVDVLQIGSGTGKLAFVNQPSDQAYHRWLATMTFKKAARKKANGKPRGVAVFCLEESSRTRTQGVAIAHDVHTLNDIQYFTESVTTRGAWDSRIEKNVYLHAREGETPPYRSLISTPVPICDVGTPDPDQSSQMQWVLMGVLNITSTEANAFTLADLAWVRTCATLWGVLWHASMRSRSST
jgi:class 3 adenylate cyclase